MASAYFLAAVMADVALARFSCITYSIRQSLGVYAWSDQRAPFNLQHAQTTVQSACNAYLYDVKKPPGAIPLCMLHNLLVEL